MMLKAFAQLRRAREFSDTIPAMWAIRRAFHIAGFGTAECREAQRVSWADFEKAYQISRWFGRDFRGKDHEPIDTIRSFDKLYERK
jgi:hypothetical protein